MRLRLKRDVVQGLVQQHALDHQWEEGHDRLTVTVKPELDFTSLLDDNGLTPAVAVQLTSGLVARHRYWWSLNDLDTFV